MRQDNPTHSQDLNSHTTRPTMPFTKEQLDDIVNKYKTDGFVVVDGLIPDQLYAPLCKAADAVTDKARAGEWKNVRMVGKQFPPWTDGESRSASVKWHYANQQATMSGDART